MVREYERMIEKRLLHCGYYEMRCNGEIVYIKKNKVTWTVYSPHMTLEVSPRMPVWTTFDEAGAFWQAPTVYTFTNGTTRYKIECLVDMVADNVYELKMMDIQEEDIRPYKNSNGAPPWQKRPRPTRLGVG